MTDALCVDLLSQGYRAMGSHGDTPMTARAKTLENFKNNKFDILVTTNLYARGINIENIKFVINYNLPQAGLLSPNEYIHRIGRCCRHGQYGTAITFFNRAADRDCAGFLQKVGIFYWCR